MLSNYIFLFFILVDAIFKLNLLFTDPSLKIIASLPNKKFLNYLIYSFIFQTGLMTYGRPEFYFLLSPSVFKVSHFKLLKYKCL